MNEIAQMVSQKFGLSPEVSQQILEFVVGQLKGRLPEGVSSHLETVLGSAVASETGEVLLDKVKGAAAGLFNKSA